MNKEPKITKCPSGPIDEDVCFQRYSHIHLDQDSRIKLPPGIHKPVKFSEGLGGSKTIFDSIKEELSEAFDLIEEQNEQNNTSKNGGNSSSIGSNED